MKKSLITSLIATFLFLNAILPASAASIVKITVSTDAEKYTSGNMINVSGTVLKDEKAGKGTSPMLQVKKDNTIVESYQWKDSEIGANGEISKTINPKKYESGYYTIQLSAKGTDLTSVSVEVVSTIIKPDPSKPDPSKPDPSKPDPSKPDPSKPDPSKPDPSKPDPSKPDPNPTIPVVPTPKPDPIPTIPLDPTPKPDPTVTPHAPEVNIVTSESIEIIGTADVGTKVKVTDKNKFYEETVTKADGTFSISLNEKIKAGTILYVTASASDKVSSETKITVTDKTPPTTPVVKRVTDKDRKVNGTTEAEAKVIIKVGEKVIGTGYADKQGKFSIQINTQRAGSILTVMATDNSGNTSISKKITVIDKTVPKTPLVKTINAISTKVTGTAEAGSKVYVKAGNKVIGSSTVSKKGTFSVGIKKQKANTRLSIYSKDKAGNVSKARMVTVKK